MKLIDGWRSVLLRAWSSRLMVISVILLIAEHSLPFWVMLPDEVRDVLPRWVFSLVPLISMLLATYARVVEQPKMRKLIANEQTKKSLTEHRAKTRAERRAAAAARIAAEEAAKRGNDNA